MTSIVLVDDHNLFRDGLAELLSSVAEFTIVAQGATGADAITLAHTHKPDIMLLDVEIPGPGAEATIKRLAEADSHLKVVVLTMHDDADLVHKLVHAGAAGYLLKTAGRQELLAAITAARRGEDTVVLSVSRKTVLALRAASQTIGTSVLSAREIEVVSCLQQGGSNRDIATRLFISEATVKRHLANVYSKLGATSRLDAVRKAVEAGLL